MSPNIGQNIYNLAAKLYPICRSITGNGVRQTLNIIKERISLNITEIKSGKQVYDWEIPKEWNITDAWVKDPSGEKIIDFKKSNLHILNYSPPIHNKLRLEELKKHLYSIPGQPDLVPYKTSYYKEQYGFCIAHSKLEELAEGEYEVFIDSSLENGSLTYGECYIQGFQPEEIVITTHICHPSLANDNLSGIAAATELARYLSAKKNKFSYRFLFIPGTIGSIAWLSENRGRLHRIVHGLSIAGLGDSGKLTYKRSRMHKAEIDLIALYTLAQSGKPFAVRNFSPYGYDERQFNSSGINLPFGFLSRTPHGEYKEYHTSADNLEFIKPDALGEAFDVISNICKNIENAEYYENLKPHCEPQLGKRGLYSMLGGHQNQNERQMAMLYLLNYSDKLHSLTSISQLSSIELPLLKEMAGLLEEKGLLKKVRK